MIVDTIPEFLSYLARIRARTMQFVDHAPGERLEWSPSGSGAFSVGDILRHVAGMERFMFAENVAGRPSRYPGHGRELATGYAEVRKYVDRLHGEAVDIIGALADADLTRSCTTPGGATMARWKWLRAMIEHEVHHRGQLVLMLRLAGIPTPPLFGLTSEEVRARSAT